MVMPCSRSAASPSTSSAKSMSPSLRPEAARVAFQPRQLIVEELVRVVQQPADQRRLAVVDRATGDEAQNVPPRFELRGSPRSGDGVLRETSEISSCFFRSMTRRCRRSINRPRRSEVRAASVSRMMSGKSSALLSTHRSAGSSRASESARSASAASLAWRAACDRRRS